MERLSVLVLASFNCRLFVAYSLLSRTLSVCLSLVHYARSTSHPIFISFVLVERYRVLIHAPPPTFAFLYLFSETGPGAVCPMGL